MVSQIDHFDVIIADSEFEALVLENSLIKRHQPRYNILLKDDKGYPYIRLSKEAYPRFSLANRAAEDGARYFGPYASRHATQNIMDALRTALRLPSCRKKFPRDIGKERPCLNFHMGKCDGYCRSENGSPSTTRPSPRRSACWRAAFRRWGRTSPAEMERAAEELRFEKAAELRDRLRAIELLGKRQKVVAGSLADTDVAGFFRGTAKSCFVVLHYRGGGPGRQGLGADGDPHGGGRGGDPVLPGAGVLRGPDPAAQADSAALRAGRPGAPHPAAVRAGGPPGGAGHPPAGGQDGPDPPGQPERRGGGGAGHHPGGAAEQAAGGAGADAGAGGAPPADGVLRHLQPGGRRHRGLHGGLCERPAPEAGLPALQAQGHGRPRRLRLHGAGAHPPLPPVSGRGREVRRQARPAPHRRRREPREGGRAGAGGP